MTVICLETIFYFMPLQGPPGLYWGREGGSVGGDFLAVVGG